MEGEIFFVYVHAGVPSALWPDLLYKAIVLRDIRVRQKCQS